MLEILEIWIVYIFKICWPLKMTSTLSKHSTKNFGVVEWEAEELETGIVKVRLGVFR